MKIKFCLFLLFLTNIIIAQEPSKVVLKGRINANTMDLEGIYVINLRTEIATITEKEGFFSITATPGDTLLFSALQLKELRLVLEPTDFQESFVEVKMESKITQLREVKVKRYDNINAVALGISPAGIKHLTQAERHLKTASGLNPEASEGSGMAGGSVGFDPLLNLISGRTAMLKKEVAAEKKLSFIQMLDRMFNEDYFRNTLKIPIEYIKGFEYYIVENDRFTTVLKTKNKSQIEFALVSLAEKYKLIISSEK